MAPGWIRRLIGFVRPHRAKVAISFGAAFLGMGVAALTPLLEKVIVDDVVGGGDRSLTPWLVLLVAAGVVRFALAYVRRFVGGRVSYDVQHDLRSAIQAKLARLDPARYEEDLHTGQLISRASADVTLVQGLLSFLPIVTGNVLLFVVSLVVMLTLSPALTLVALAVGPVLFVIGLRLRRSVYPASWDSQQQAGVVAGVVDEAVSGVRVVKAFGRETGELEKLGDAALGLYRSRVRAVRIQARYQPTLQVVPVFGQVAIVGFGGWLAIRGSITLGTFLAFTTYLAQLVSPVRMLAGLLAVGQQARAGVERIGDLLDTRPTIEDRPGAVELSEVRGAVRFERVGFAYGGGPAVLDGFDLDVAPGETVALVGASGSGKSTVALLLPRFYDVDEGGVRIDGIDVRDLTLASLRRSIGVVFEESFLFSDSVRANIAYGCPDATDDEVAAAARAAGAEEFIVALPDGYDTVVGERGLTLSGGQRQRVALARALLTDPRILVLDDATSAVDARTEEAIHATLRRLMRGRTTVVIAHRRSTLRLASRIVVVEGGRVLDEGTHDELVERCGRYRALITGDGGLAQADLDPAPVPAVVPAVGSGAVPMVAGRSRRSARVAAEPSGGDGFMGIMAATPELEAAVAALPPADDEPEVDPVAAARPDPRFSLRRLLRPFRWPLALGVALVCIDALATLAAPALVRYGIDHGIRVGATDVLLATTAVFAAITLVAWVNGIGQATVTGRTAERLLYVLRIRIFAHLQRLALDYYERELAGRIMTRMTTDVDALASVLQTGLVTALVNLVSFVGVGIALLVIDPRLGLVALCTLPPLVVATVWFRVRSGRAYDVARDRVAVVNAELQEGLSGVRVIQAHVQEDTVAERFGRASRAHVEARVGAQRLVALYFPFVELLSQVATALVLGVGAALVTGGSLTAGGLVAFVLYLQLFFSPVQQLSQVFDSYQQARIALRRIGDLLATETATPEPASPVARPHRAGRAVGAICFEGVRFAYPGAGVDALARVDLDVAPGETVALVGATGAGKSTIVKLVARFYDPTEGRVLVDGVDLRSLDLADHRHRLGYVPQEAFLFSGTVRDNIAYGRPDASDAEVEAAAGAVGADALIASLPGGYDHPIAERGRSLSAGQRQLLCLARAHLVDPDIVLLDEATANLDLLTEARVSAAMGATAAGRTTLVIAHRLPTAAAADRIVVLEQGRIVEQGTHDELRDAEGPYAAAWAAFEGGLDRVALAD